MLNRIVISAPFGNYLNFDGATKTVGTFTWDARGGKLWRLWKVLSTVRYYWRLKSWVNRLGLPNPGIKTYSVKGDEIVSIQGFNENEWRNLVSSMSTEVAIEFNLSCPNVQNLNALQDALPWVKYALGRGNIVIAKLPPIGWFDMLVELGRCGVRHFHCCNTIPTSGGGMSGKILKPFSLEAVRGVREMYENAYIIGGGGVTCWEDCEDYFYAGADSVSVASMLFFPWNWKKVRQFIELSKNRTDFK
jgi:dihydroorotate dehydrogenase